MRSISFIVGCLLFFQGQAQVGISVFREYNDVKHWPEVLASFPVPKESKIFESGYAISIDYWFRLKNQRIEFMPDLMYSRFHTSFNTIEEISNYKMDVFGAGIRVHLYFLDFLGDCDCPTFSKQGNFFKKGLFLMFRPGINYYDQSLAYNTLSQQTSAFGPAFSAGLGFDIGINDLITITPILAYKVNPGVRWESFGPSHGFLNLVTAEEKSLIQQIQLGLRIGFRADFSKY